MPEKKEREMMYYLHLFKIEGHETWRSHLAMKKDTWSTVMQQDKVKVTDLKIYKINRITGSVKEVGMLEM